MSDTTITLRGRVGTDLAKNITQSGQVTVRFRLAVTHWFASVDGVLTQGQTKWYTVRAWDRLANNLMHSISKGEPVIVVGRPTASAWRDKTTGEVRSDLVITAQSVGHDLTNGWAQYMKTRRQVPEHEDLGAPDVIVGEAAGNEGEAVDFEGAGTQVHGDGLNRSRGVCLEAEGEDTCEDEGEPDYGKGLHAQIDEFDEDRDGSGDLDLVATNSRGVFTGNY